MVIGVAAICIIGAFWLGLWHGFHDGYADGTRDAQARRAAGVRSHSGRRR